MNKKEAEARQRLAAAKAALTAYEAETAKAKAAGAVAAKRRSTFVKRSPVVVVSRLQPHMPVEHRTRPMPEWGIGYGAKGTEKEILAALLRDKDALKVELGAGGVGTGIKSGARKLRVVDKAAVKRIAYAKARMEVAQRKARDAERAYQTVQDAEWEAGTRVEPEALAAAIAKYQALLGAETRGRFGGNDEWRRRELEREIANAEAHAKAVREGVDCPESACVAARAEAAETKKELERIATLPRRTLKCPEHGTSRAPTEKVETGVNADNVEKWGLGEPLPEWGRSYYGDWRKVPVVRSYCAKCAKWFVRLEETKAGLDAARKAAAKAAKLAEQQQRAAAKALATAQKKGVTVDADDLQPGDVITVECPHCEEVLTDAEVLEYDGDGDEDAAGLYIELPCCEDTASIHVLDNVIRTKAAAKAA